MAERNPFIVKTPMYSDLIRNYTWEIYITLGQLVFCATNNNIK